MSFLLCAASAELTGHIPEAERRLNSLREAVASINITLRLFDPRSNPEDIEPRRPYKRCSGFAHRELPRLLADMLRAARPRFLRMRLQPLLRSRRE
jgi:hypothetical protein